MKNLREPVEQQDSKGKSQGDCVPLYNRKGEKALKMQDETGIIPLKINLLVRAASSSVRVEKLA